MKTRTKRTFAQLPGDYAGLCRLHLPRVIRDRVDYDNTMEMVEAMVLHASRFTPDQKDYFELLRIYTKSHQLKLDDGSVVPWIDENLNPANGDWISRTRLKAWKNGTWDAGKGGEERGKDYNHSTYCDLIISGLVGLRPRPDETVEVNPLVPPAWDAFCLDRIPYHGRSLTILWDKTGQRYGKGKGLRMFADGKEIASSANLGRLTGPLPELSGERRSLP